MMELTAESNDELTNGRDVEGEPHDGIGTGVQGDSQPE